MLFFYFFPAPDYEPQLCDPLIPHEGETQFLEAQAYVFSPLPAWD